MVKLKFYEKVCMDGKADILLELLDLAQHGSCL